MARKGKQRALKTDLSSGHDMSTYPLHTCKPFISLFSHHDRVTLSRQLQLVDKQYNAITTSKLADDLVRSLLQISRADHEAHETIFGREEPEFERAISELSGSETVDKNDLRASKKLLLAVNRNLFGRLYGETVLDDIYASASSPKSPISLKDAAREVEKTLRASPGKLLNSLSPSASHISRTSYFDLPPTRIESDASSHDETSNPGGFLDGYGVWTRMERQQRPMLGEAEPSQCSKGVENELREEGEAYLDLLVQYIGLLPMKKKKLFKW